MRLQTSATDRHRGQEGFTLLEMVCVLAIIGLVASMILPAIPRGTSTAKLQSFALATATLLKQDRMTALATHRVVSTGISAQARIVRSGASERIIRIPDDVTIDALTPRLCQGRAIRSKIVFLATGLSCGGVIRLSKSGSDLQIRVNWLTGAVDVAPL